MTTKTPMPTNSMPRTAAAQPRGRHIYLAGPWTPVCGGIYKVVDYLIQWQATTPPADAAQLRPLDTRSGGPAFFSMWFLFTALLKILRGRIRGDLAGVHVNVAERLSLVRKGTIVIACRALGIPVVLHLHAQMRNFYLGLPAPLQRMTRWVFSLAAAVVVIGPAARRFVIKDLQIPSERVELVYNGVPEPESGPARRAAAADGLRHVLFLGRLGDLKGVSDLLQAAAHPALHGVALRISVAGGGDVAGYQAKARALGVDHVVRFEGLCDQAKVASLLAEADVLVLPSYDEVLPLVILEALASGVAVVCTPVGEIPAVLTQGVEGCFVTPGDIDGIAATLQQVLQQPGLAETLGRNGRALYERQFSVAHFFGSVARVHQKHFGVCAHPMKPVTPARDGIAGAAGPAPSATAAAAPRNSARRSFVE